MQPLNDSYISNIPYFVSHVFSGLFPIFGPRGRSDKKVGRDRSSDDQSLMIRAFRSKIYIVSLT